MYYQKGCAEILRSAQDLSWLREMEIPLSVTLRSE
jgi:hypothetical protein